MRNNVALNYNQFSLLQIDSLFVLNHLISTQRSWYRFKISAHLLCLDWKWWNWLFAELESFASLWLGLLPIFAYKLVASHFFLSCRFKATFRWVSIDTLKMNEMFVTENSINWVSLLLIYLPLLLSPSIYLVCKNMSYILS